MSTELQPDDLNLETEEQETLEDQTQPAEEAEEVDAGSAPATAEQRAKQVVFTEEQQQVFNKAIAEKVRKQRDAEREAERLRKELEEIKAKVPQQARPVVPDLPDAYALSEAEFRERVRQREQAIAEAARWDAQQKLLDEQRQLREQELQRQQQEVLTNTVKTYTERAIQLGVKPEELQVAGNTVAQFGIDDSLTQFILNDDHGPLLTKYLAANLLELEELRSLPPTVAAVRLATTIKPKLAAMKPRTTSAPDPLEIPRGSGAAPRPRGPKGATFE